MLRHCVQKAMPVWFQCIRGDTKFLYPISMQHQTLNIGDLRNRQYFGRLATACYSSLLPVIAMPTRMAPRLSK